MSCSMYLTYIPIMFNSDVSFSVLPDCVTWAVFPFPLRLNQEERKDKKNLKVLSYFVHFSLNQFLPCEWWILYDISFFFMVMKHPIQIWHKSHKIFPNSSFLLRVDVEWMNHEAVTPGCFLHWNFYSEYSGSSAQHEKKPRTRGKQVAVQAVLCAIKNHPGYFGLVLPLCTAGALERTLHSRVLCDAL